MFIEQIGLLGSFLLMSIALAMDAFSVSLTIGLQNIRLKKIALIGFIIGAFHVVLPFLGIVIGGIISLKLEQTASVIGGFILLCLGLHIFFSAFKSDEKQKMNLTGVKIITIALIVSVDSFPVGVSLGMSEIYQLFVIFLFGITSMILAWVGMLLGRKSHAHLSKYSEIFGGTILSLIGILTIF